MSSRYSTSAYWTPQERRLARAAGPGPRLVLPGKLMDDGTSSYFIGNVVASLPDGVTLPVTTSAIACPDSWPGCHASRMASGTPRQLAVSMTPPTLSTTSTLSLIHI